MGEGKEKVEFTILDRTRVTTFPKLKQPVVIVQVTYFAPPLPPATIEIPEAEWSKEKELELIKKDVQERLAFKPETYVV